MGQVQTAVFPAGDRQAVHTVKLFAVQYVGHFVTNKVCFPRAGLCCALII